MGWTQKGQGGVFGGMVACSGSESKGNQRVLKSLFVKVGGEKPRPLMIGRKISFHLRQGRLLGGRGGQP